jgi:pimeloyl-ACP methyl ester carboxylesterase
MATFVLVHGAWHGGWCWGRVWPTLQGQGHTVYAPTLTGAAGSLHLLSPAVDLCTHVQDIVGLLTYEELTEVVLVGHSYGGMVISAVAALAPERLRRLVYLDAFVPQDGQRIVDLVPAEFFARQLELARDHGDGWRIPPPPPARYGIVADDDVRWAAPKLCAWPLLTFTQAVSCADDPGIPRTYIACTEFEGPFGVFATRARSEPGWTYRALPTSHDAMVTMPGDLAELLLEAAG